jgi:hypothetical protein
MTATAAAAAVRREVQAHGFSWEKNLLALYGATDDEIKTISYCSKIDLPAAYNRVTHCDLSIKTTCSKNAICMGDCLRVYDALAAGTPLHLTTVFYAQDDATKAKRLTEIVEVDLTDSLSVLFGSLTRDQLLALDSLVKAVPQRRKPTPEEYTAMYALRDTLQPLSGAIHLDIKCNSQQSRLQCSFNRFQAFLKANPTRIIARSTTPSLHGKEVLASVTSGRRVFKKKATPDPLV